MYLSRLLSDCFCPLHSPSGTLPHSPIWSLLRASRGTAPTILRVTLRRHGKRTGPNYLRFLSEKSSRVGVEAAGAPAHYRRASK